DPGPAPLELGRLPRAVEGAGTLVVARPLVLRGVLGEPGPSFLTELVQLLVVDNFHVSPSVRCPGTSPGAESRVLRLSPGPARRCPARAVSRPRSRSGRSIPGRASPAPGPDRGY